MPRITLRAPDGDRYTLDPALAHAGPDGLEGEAVEKLAAFETLMETLERQVREIPGELAALRAQGREKSVTFRELAAQKMMAQLWLDMAKDAGVTG